MSARTSPARWPWVLLLVASVLVPFWAFFSWSGGCADFAAGGGESHCTSEPSIAWPAAWLLTAVGAVAFLLGTIRLVRLVRMKD